MCAAFAEFRARLLDTVAVPRSLLNDTVASADSDAEAIMGALGDILHGYHIGRPR